MTDLSSWTAYFQDFGQFSNGFLFTPCPSDWILYPSHGFGHLLLEPCQPVNVRY